MRENIAIDDKERGERRRYGFDWGPYLAGGDSIDGDPLAPALVYGTVDISPGTSAEGSVQTFELSGGEVGAVAVRLAVDTVAGELLQQVVTLRIL